MNDYEYRQQQRKERYEELADKNRAKLEAYYEASNRAVAGIEPGQPILVGHHSESKHRNALERCHNAMGKSIEADRTADYYAQKAASVGSGGISSDDPDAVEKLQSKLQGMQRQQALMKLINKAHTAFLKNPHSLESFDLNDETKQNIRQYVPRYSWEPHPIAPYQFTNLNANIKRVEQRIAELTRKSAVVSSVKEYEGFTVKEDADENRVMFIFPGKPDEATRSILKFHAFKWSPSRGAWTRMLNGNGRWAAECVINKLQEKSQ